MLRIGFWNFYSSLNSALFVEPNAPIGDDLLLPFIRLKEAGASRGISCEVLSRENIEALDATVLIDFPDTRDPLVQRAFQVGGPRYLIVFEPPTVRWENYANGSAFTRIFTWEDGGRVGVPRMSKYVKLNYASEFPSELPPPLGRKPLCMIAASKHSAHPSSLYERRREVAEFYAGFADDPTYRFRAGSFDLYGPGWNGNPRWCGTVPAGQKRATLSKYQYAIVHENGRFPGYITEKLFDCFIAGTVPLYLGAPNVGDYVPSECYVDLARFGETWTKVGRMQEWLENVGAAEYAARREAIGAFLKSSAAKPFTTNHFARTILDTLDGDLTET